MEQLAIHAESLSKMYRIGMVQKRHDTLRDVLADSLRGFHFKQNGREKSTHDELWALRDVSFDVHAGEVLGIIGRNGAGKSTLLKILSRITEPTRGRAIINGRVGSLLEVGTGFHPELTGRENIYLNGAILGMTRREIEKKFDEIVEFSEIERFLDTPVKRYSSGMYVRLAFAVAAHLEPEILLVDEVLAVGDAAFQKKCLGKMGDVAHGGRTVLFVSHNMVAIQSLCSQGIWIEGGVIASRGKADQVVQEYLQSTFINLTQRTWEDPSDAPGDDQVRLRSIAIRPAPGAQNQLIDMQTPLEIEIQFLNHVPDSLLHTTLHFVDEHGRVAFSTFPSDEVMMRPLPPGLVRSVCCVPANLLNSGTYRLNLLMVRNHKSLVFRLNDALMFEVLDTRERKVGWLGKVAGSVHPLLNWEVGVIGEQQ